jgi:hypothetical protein
MVVGPAYEISHVTEATVVVVVGSAVAEVTMVFDNHSRDGRHGGKQRQRLDDW